MQRGTHPVRQARRPSRGGPRRLTLSSIALSLLASVLVVVVATPQIAQAANIVVTTAVDEQTANGQCSLREAILNANGGSNIDCAAGGGADVITFNISPARACTRSPSSTSRCRRSPAKSTSTRSTQPGWTPTSLAIEITNNFPNTNTLVLSNTTNSVVRGFILNGATGPGPGAAITTIDGTGTVIAGNWIGTDETGLAASSNGTGIYVIGTTNVRIGGPAVTDRNVIAGSTGAGIIVTGNGGSDAILTDIQGNLIGTNRLGTAAVANGTGIFLQQDITSTTVRDNVISGNTLRGVALAGPELTNTTFHTNTIGLNLAQSAAIPNGIGIQFFGSEVGNANIGVSSAGGENVISGNLGDGIAFAGDVIAARVFNNFIGTSDDGVTPFGNGGNGISLTDFSLDTIIGGVAGVFQPNIIANNGGHGVRMSSVNPLAVIGNPVRGNHIFDNGGRGIALLPTGSANDPGDTDVGPNNLQNFPEITMTIQGATLFAAWTMDSAGTESLYPIDIDFYKTGTDVTEGKTWITSTAAAAQGVNTADPLRQRGHPRRGRRRLHRRHGDRRSRQHLRVLGGQPGGGRRGRHRSSSRTSVTLPTPRRATASARRPPATASARCVPRSRSRTTSPARTRSSSTSARCPAVGGGDDHDRRRSCRSITDQVIIDGLSQPGASCGVVAARPEGGDQRLRQLVRRTARESPGTLSLRGMVVNSYPTYGVFVDTSHSGSSFECNFIGTDAAGNAVRRLVRPGRHLS